MIPGAESVHNSTVQQPLTSVSPNSNPTILIWQAEVEFACKHNVIPFRCAYPPFIAPLMAQVSVAPSQGLIDALLTFHSATKTTRRMLYMKKGSKPKCLPASRELLVPAADYDANVSSSAAPREERVYLRLGCSDLIRSSFLKSLNNFYC
ncbi:hypothetical protein TNCV_2476591 [Trichonephila clavipes]|nr:hypothetical protein TNCV_2476591 [Trichonephila clavipes]